jgi:hypothetical protein
LETIIGPENLRRVFLLSPANTAGERGRLLLNPDADFELARRLRTVSVTICEIYSFISGLYFRGKASYVGRFANPRDAFVIVPGLGLVSMDTQVTLGDIEEISKIRIDLGDVRYREPFERDATRLSSSAGSVVLLGSVATPKYVTPLLSVFGERLLFPEEFAGRGDMSRGGLMLRCAASGEELRYVSALSAARHGSRPPSLPNKPPPP